MLTTEGGRFAAMLGSEPDVDTLIMRTSAGVSSEVGSSTLDVRLFEFECSTSNI